MTTYKRPGVYVGEDLTRINAISGDDPASAAFVAPNGRGPTEVTKVESWTQFTRFYGGFDTANGSTRLPYALFTFFANGGRTAYISRAVGDGAVKATRTLMDRAATAIATLRVDALSEGAWGNTIFLDVENYTDFSGTVVTGRFNINVYYGSSAAADRVERFTNLSMTDVESKINSTSFYIRVEDLSSATASPDNIPAEVTGVALATGANGAAPTTTDLTAAWERFDVLDFPLDLNMPGEDNEAAVALAQAWAENRGDVFMVIDPQNDMTPDNTAGTGIIDLSQSLDQTSYSAIYYPRVTFSDPASTTRNASVELPPGGAVLGQYAQTDAQRGVFKAPAGINNRITGAVGLERRLTNGELDTLNLAGVNVIRHIPGSGICVFGTRTMKSGDSSIYIPVRRTLIHLKKVFKDSTRFAIFEPNDEALWFQIRVVLSQYLTSFWQQGGLKGTTQEEAFFVKCDDDLNPPEVIQSGEVRAEVGVALQYPAEFVVITIGQFEGGATATEA